MDKKKNKAKKNTYPPEEECLWISQEGFHMARMINDEGKFVDEPIHYMVATAFVPNPNSYEYVWFIDGNAANYQASNLQWQKWPQKLMS